MTGSAAARAAGTAHKKFHRSAMSRSATTSKSAACTTIDRATFGSTRVGAGTKIDNLVMIGHNCQIGRHNLFVKVGRHRRFGHHWRLRGDGRPGWNCRSPAHRGDRSLLGAKAGVHKDVPPDQRMLGAPATPDKEQMRIMMSLEKLPQDSPRAQTN